MPEKEFSNEYIKYVFTEDEIKELSVDLARNIADLETSEADRKAVASDFKSQIDRLKATVQSLAQKLNNGYEYKAIKCEVGRNYKKKTVSFMRVDTGEVVKTRPMTNDELQMKLA